MNEQLTSAPFVPSEFRVYLIINAPETPTYIPVKTMGEAIIAVKTMIAIRESLEKRYGVDTIWISDISGLEYKDEDDDWYTFYDTEGYEFEEYFNDIEENNLSGNLDKPLSEIVVR